MHCAGSNARPLLLDYAPGLRANLDPDETVYVYALIVPDDFGLVMGYANTIRHLAASAGRPLDKWYFAQWLTGAWTSARRC
jgi:hypothetical protein